MCCPGCRSCGVMESSAVPFRLRVIIIFRDNVYVIIILYSWHLVICEYFWFVCVEQLILGHITMSFPFLHKNWVWHPRTSKYSFDAQIHPFDIAWLTNFWALFSNTRVVLHVFALQAKSSLRFWNQAVAKSGASGIKLWKRMTKKLT
jgi:hypothetical protein